jgi:hypothetical protein
LSATLWKWPDTSLLHPQLVIFVSGAESYGVGEALGVGGAVGAVELLGAIELLGDGFGFGNPGPAVK